MAVPRFGKALLSSVGRLADRSGKGSKMGEAAAPQSRRVMAHAGAIDISQGFQIERPLVFVPWETSEEGLKSLLDPHGLRSVGYGSYSISCTSLKGLDHELDFSFSGTRNGTLRELSFYLGRGVRNQPRLEESYAQLQSHAEATFGPPTGRKQGSLRRLEDCVWTFGAVEIRHRVVDRIGPVEEFKITLNRE